MDAQPLSNTQRRKREREARVREHKEMIAGRRKWLAEHPDIANKPAGERPWGSSQEASRGSPWWGVKRLGPHGDVNHRSMFRHATEDSATREAGFLAETFPGAVFVVLAMVSVHCVGEPEVRLGADAP